MGKRKKQFGRCGYCGAPGELTREHIIPRGLFGDPVPSDIPCIWVCPDCNNRKSADDNYVRDFFASDIRMVHHPVAQANFAKVRRSARNNHSTFANAVTKAQLVHLYSAGGIYLGQGYKVPADFGRIDRFTTTLVRGLYYYHSSKRPPEDVTFTIKWWEEPDVFMNVGHTLLRSGAPHITVGDRSVFECVYGIAAEDPRFSIWLLNFYCRIFISIVTKGESAQREASPTSLPQIR